MESVKETEGRNQHSLKIYQQAKRNVGVTIGFYYHLAVYVTVNLLLFAINHVFSPTNYWVIFPAIFWGIGIVLHGLSVLLFSLGLRDRMMAREMKKVAARMEAAAGK